jgi:hypothetical protein
MKQSGRTHFPAAFVLHSIHYPTHLHNPPIPLTPNTGQSVREMWVAVGKLLFTIDKIFKLARPAVAFSLPLFFCLCGLSPNVLHHCIHCWIIPIKQMCFPTVAGNPSAWSDGDWNNSGNAVPRMETQTWFTPQSHEWTFFLPHGSLVSLHFKPWRKICLYRMK